MHSLVIFGVYLINNWLSEEYQVKLDKVNDYGRIFIQFPTFTYLKVGYFKGKPYTLPRYATDKIILMELVKQLMEVQSY